MITFTFCSYLCHQLFMHTQRKPPPHKLLVNSERLCSSAWHARIATTSLHVAWLKALGTERLEALHTATCRWRLRGRVDDIVALDGCVPVHSYYMVWRPASGTTTAATDKLHCHSQSLGARYLRALRRVILASKLRCTAIWICESI